MIGTRLAQFEITGSLGVGGMGEVYRARDTTLDREVAVKVLPEEFVADPERLARFRREAKVLAALNHPNIAAIYELGEAVPSGENATGEAAGDGAVHFLVMELAPGETLADRLARGAMPLEEALGAALQIAEAFEAAHRQGIIHRDLKPANVKLSPDGRVKVLDFGLAKALDPTPLSGDPSLSPAMAASPTLTYQATLAGVLLGTAGYMSPEQAKGKPADKRSDIWSFGVVLWEMLTGERLFQGDSTSDTVAAVLRDPVDPEALDAALPNQLVRLVDRCLQRDPHQRLHDIADARIVLAELLEGGAEPARRTGSAASGRRPWLLGLAAGLVGLAAGVGLTQLGPGSEMEVSATPDRLFVEIGLPPETILHMATTDPGPPAISADGARIAFTALEDSGSRRLWVRELDARAASPLPGTDGAQYPFWSPDGRSVGYFAHGGLWVTSVSSGSPRRLADALIGKGGSWSPGDDILFSSSSDTPLQMIPAAGGDAVEVTEVDRSSHNSHRHPRWLPDGRRFLYLARAAAGNVHTIMLGSLDDEPHRTIASSPTQAELAGDHLLLVEQGNLVARRLSAETLDLGDEATVVVDDLRLMPGAAYGVFSASATDRLIYLSGNPSTIGAIEVRDRLGRLQGTVGEPDDVTGVVLSPDGGQLALSIPGASGTQDIWLLDLETELRSRLTLTVEDEAGVAFSPAGDELVFGASPGGRAHWNLYAQDLSGTGGRELLLEGDGPRFATSWSVDGLIAFDGGPPSIQDIHFLDRATGEVTPAVTTPASENGGQFSPDGRWFAFVSDESGRPEAYVMSIDAPGKKWQVSDDSAVGVWWRGDGRELIYQRANGWLVARPASTTGGTIDFGAPESLFRAPPPQFVFKGVAPAPDFETFYTMARIPDERTVSLLQGWTTLLPR